MGTVHHGYCLSVQFSQQSWGLHVSSDDVRSWVSAAPDGQLGNWICCSLLQGCLEQRGQQISICSQPQAELTIRGPRRGRPRHYCQLWMQSRPTAPGTLTLRVCQAAGGSAGPEGGVWEVRVWDTSQDFLQGRGRWKPLPPLESLQPSCLPSSLFPLEGYLRYWSVLLVFSFRTETMTLTKAMYV